MAEEECDSLEVKAAPEEVVSGSEDGNSGSGCGQSPVGSM